jgi:hypothetical protein
VEAPSSDVLFIFARRGALAGASVTSAAWKIGTGIAAARLRVFAGASVLSAAGASLGASVTSATLPLTTDLIFFTARLRGDFGSIAITVNPLRHHICNGLLWPKSP